MRSIFWKKLVKGLQVGCGHIVWPSAEVLKSFVAFIGYRGSNPTLTARLRAVRDGVRWCKLRYFVLCTRIPPSPHVGTISRYEEYIVGFLYVQSTFLSWAPGSNLSFQPPFVYLPTHHLTANPSHGRLYLRNLRQVPTNDADYVNFHQFFLYLWLCCGNFSLFSLELLSVISSWPDFEISIKFTL